MISYKVDEMSFTPFVLHFHTLLSGKGSPLWLLFFDGEMRATPQTHISQAKQLRSLTMQRERMADKPRYQILLTGQKCPVFVL